MHQIGLQRECVLVAVECLRQIVAARIFVPHHQAGVDHLWILLHDLAQRRQAFVVRAILHVVACRGHEVEQFDLVLGIGELRTVGVCGRDERADVTERGEPRARVGIDVDRRFDLAGAVARIHRVQLRGHPIAESAAFAVDVLSFVRIALEIVQLGTRRIDVLEPAGRQRSQLAPAVVVARIHRFRVRGQTELANGARHQRDERSAVDSLRRRHAEQLQHRRQNVDASDDVADAPRAQRIVRRADVVLPV